MNGTNYEVPFPIYFKSGNGNPTASFKSTRHRIDVDDHEVSMEEASNRSTERGD
jgi:hypothetical protein